MNLYRTVRRALVLLCAAGAVAAVQGCSSGDETCTCQCLCPQAPVNDREPTVTAGSKDECDDNCKAACPASGFQSTYRCTKG